MNILAHGWWAGAGVRLAGRRSSMSMRTAALAVGLAVAPDGPHLLPIVGWAVFGIGTSAAVEGYAYAFPGQEQALPTTVEFVSHHLHSITRSAIIAALVTLLVWTWSRRLWIALLGWWSHVVIDVFTHSADDYPSPVLYPITRVGFDGIAWIGGLSDAGCT